MRRWFPVLLVLPFLGAAPSCPPKPTPSPTPTPPVNLCADHPNLCAEGSVCVDTPDGPVCEAAPVECLPGVPWCHEMTPPASCGNCKHQPPGQPCQMAPACPQPIPTPTPTPPSGCWSDESKMVAVAGPATMTSTVTTAMKKLENVSGAPHYMLEALAAEIVKGGTCAFAGQEAVFVLNAAKLWEEFHAVFFADGVTGQWITGGKWMANHRGDQGVPPPVSDACGEPVPPPLVDFNLHCVESRKWDCDATPIVYGCEFCAAIGLGEMPGQPGVKRCNCPPGNEDTPIKRMACERKVIGGAALWRSSTGVEVNPENHLQARCSSACSWIEVCKTDGTKCTRVTQ